MPEIEAVLLSSRNGNVYVLCMAMSDTICEYMPAFRVPMGNFDQCHISYLINGHVYIRIA